MIWRDARRFSFAFGSSFISPLGSGAVAGTTLPIDRETSAREMGFEDERGLAILTENSMDAVADRDVHMEFSFACALCAVHLSRIAEDMILWNSAEFGFIRLPDAFTTGSSLMPQKKNPDCMELIRGKSARMTGNLMTLLMMVKGLPLTYNRDLQEDKPPVFDSHEQTLACLSVLQGAIAGSEMNPARCAQAVADPLLLATDLADYLVLKGTPFREAHHQVGALVALAERQGVPLNRLPHAEALAVAPKLGKDWTEVFDLKRAFAKRENLGMPGFAETQKALRRWRRRLAL
jgi:argininosuccinate lyase